MSARSQEQDSLYFEQGKQAVLAAVSPKAVATSDAVAARKHAQSALDAFKTQKDLELEQASTRFKRFQIIEFIMGALVIIQMVIFLLQGEPYIWPLAATATLCAVLYVVAAVLDSKAKRVRQIAYFESLAAKKARIKNRADGKGVELEFKGIGTDSVDAV